MKVPNYYFLGINLPIPATHHQTSGDAKVEGEKIFFESRDSCYDRSALQTVNSLKKPRAFIDFCGVTRGFQCAWDEDNDSMSLLAESVDNMLVDRLHNNTEWKGLSELILTGLPENDLGLFVLRVFSLLVHMGGEVGIGTGQEGKRYLVSSDQYLRGSMEDLILENEHPRLEPVEPKVHWLLAEHVPALIESAATDTNSKWLFGDVGLASQRLN
ncbi:MAG: hypothetical protein Q9209_002026 [Squamulea sp. 1 TL-2023]